MGLEVDKKEGDKGRDRLLRLIDKIQTTYTSGADNDSLFRQIYNLRQQLMNDTFKVTVIGNFKSGKSTLINALLGQEILPANALPTTAVITEIKYGEKPKAVLHFVNPLPEKMYYGMPKILSNMRRFQMKDVPLWRLK